jgi:nucleoside-diphosphate-sugar epimerase
LVNPDRRFVLLTGAAGRIGAAFHREHSERYRFRLADLVTENLTAMSGGAHEVVRLDVDDAAACRLACEGIDTVVHLAADPSPEADWGTSLLPNNIRGVVNVFQAARDAGCRRVVFASSVHAVAGHPWGRPLPDDAAPRPINLYGASKVFGEAVTAAFAAQGLSGIAIRIGAYDAPWLHERAGPRETAAYVSARDLNHLLVRCIETDAIEYAVVAGVSANHPNRFDLVRTRALLGYAPRDDGFRVLDFALGEE